MVALTDLWQGVQATARPPRLRGWQPQMQKPPLAERGTEQMKLTQDSSSSTKKKTVRRTVGRSRLNLALGCIGRHQPLAFFLCPYHHINPFPSMKLPLPVIIWHVQKKVEIGVLAPNTFQLCDSWSKHQILLPIYLSLPPGFGYKFIFQLSFSLWAFSCQDHWIGLGCQHAPHAACHVPGRASSTAHSCNRMASPAWTGHGPVWARLRNSTTTSTAPSRVATGRAPAGTPGQ